MAIKLAIIDLDGTLLDSNQAIGERSRNAILRAKENDVIVTFATGRMISASSQYADSLGVSAPMVALNGALVQKHNDGKPLIHSPLSAEIFSKMLPVLAQSEAAVTIVLGDTSFGWNIDEFTRKRLSSWIVGIQDISPDDSPAAPTIAMVAGHEDFVRKTTEQLKSLEISGIQFFLFPSIRYYPMWYLEIRADGVDKGSGVRALRENLRISMEDILVIGDYLNDLPMFAEAGIRAAVANSHEEVIAAADYVSTLSCDQDGVGEIIERLILRS